MAEFSKNPKVDLYYKIKSIIMDMSRDIDSKVDDVIELCVDFEDPTDPDSANFVGGQDE